MNIFSSHLNDLIQNIYEVKTPCPQKFVYDKNIKTNHPDPTTFNKSCKTGFLHLPEKCKLRYIGTSIFLFSLKPTKFTFYQSNSK